MNKVFLALILLFSTVQITFARNRYPMPERVAAPKCSDKDIKRRYKNEGKICKVLKKNLELTGTCRKGYCRE